eukprot:5368012-Pleurochrysis_carterae.AAC.1
MDALPRLQIAPAIYVVLFDSAPFPEITPTPNGMHRHTERAQQKSWRCLLHSTGLPRFCKLTLLNCCIKRKLQLERERRGAAWTAGAGGGGGGREGDGCGCGGGGGGGVGGVCGVGGVVDGAVGEGVGRLSPLCNVLGLESGLQLWIPRTQEGVPLTDDV